MTDLQNLLVQAINKNDYAFVKQCLQYSNYSADIDGLFDNIWEYNRITSLRNFKTLLGFIENGKLPFDELAFHINDICEAGWYINKVGVDDNTCNNVARGRLSAAIWERIKFKLLAASRAFIQAGDYEVVIGYMAIIEYFDCTDEPELDIQLLEFDRVTNS